MKPPRTYATPAAFKQALEARIRTKIAETGEAIERVRTLLVLDRLAVRLVEEFGDRMLLKGGMALHYRIEGARLTKDLDTRATGDPEHLLGQLRAAGDRDLGDFLRFSIEEDPRNPAIVGEGVVYDGRRYRVTPHLAGKLYAQVFGLDVAFGDVLFGDIQEVDSSDFLAFAGVSSSKLPVYPRDTHVAEKLHAYTLPRERTNQRVKDLPDLAILARTGPFDATALRTAIDRTFTFRDTHPPPRAFPEPPPGWAVPYAEMAEANALPWPDLPAVTEAVRIFLDPVLADRPGHWDETTWTWLPP